MRQVFRKIPVYTGDVSGVCSALFELGGMVVMHDPSGCNSTYNTHDEIRWYDHDSLIFLSGLDEMDAIMGSDDRLIHDIVEAARIYSPAFIAVANSPIPYITGMDFDAVCRTVEEKTGIPSFYISTNGMHDYVHGAGLALLRIAERFTSSVKPGTEQEPHNLEHIPEHIPDHIPESAGIADTNTHRISCNLLGLTPLDFAHPSTLHSLHSKFAEAGVDILSSWAMDRPKEEQEKEPMDPRQSLMDRIRLSSNADVNILLSSVGFPAAQYMYEKYGIPFVAGIPARGVEKPFFEAVKRAVQTGQIQYPFRERAEVTVSRKSPEKTFEDNADNADKTDAAVISDKKEKQAYCFIGEPVVMASLAAQTAALTGSRTYVFGATEGASAFLGDTDAPLTGEEEIQAALGHLMEDGSTLKVIADPCYGDVLSEGCSLIRLPHLAFSGRIFLSEIPDLMNTVILSLPQSVCGDVKTL